jgi:ABC-2 type transport system permease protein
MYKYYVTARMSAQEQTNGGILYSLPTVLLKICTLIPLLYLWKTIMSSGAKAEMSLEQMLSYTFISSILADMLVVKTAATGWLSEGVLLKLYGRPFSVLGQLMAQTVGGWVPMLLMYSVPVLFLAPVLGVRLIPASPAFFLSLLLCVSLGFAIDFLFACLTIRLRNINWLIDRIRAAIIVVLSGTIIPIRFLPFGLSTIMKFQPFAALGGSPLSIFVGAGDVGETLLLQIAWNIILWPAAIFAFKKSQEGMVSYGG